MSVSKGQRKELYYSVCKLRRKIALENPLLNFRDIVFVKREINPWPEKQGNYIATKYTHQGSGHGKTLTMAHNSINLPIEKIHSVGLQIGKIDELEAKRKTQEILTRQLNHLSCRKKYRTALILPTSCLPQRSVNEAGPTKSLDFLTPIKYSIKREKLTG